jgi:hypothetical protein
LNLRPALIATAFLVLACAKTPATQQASGSGGAAAPGMDGSSSAVDAGGSGGTTAIDARADTTPDAKADATPDVTVDAAVDVTIDATADATPDVTIDVTPDATPDAPRIDATADAVTGGTVDAQSDAASAGDPAKLTMFYLDVTNGRVMTANVQSPKPRVLVASAGQGPDGVAVDVAGGHVYWTGMGVPANDDGFVMRSDLDGTNVTTLVPAGGTFTPKQLKLDLAGGKMYWSDREGMRVQRANLDGSNVESLIITATGDQARMDNSNWCVGIALDLAGGWLYWSQKGPADGGVGSLRRASLTMPDGQTAANRTDIEILYAGLPEPIDIDIDVAAGYIYWTDRADNTVSRGPIAIPTGSTAATRKDRQILVMGVSVAIGVTLDLPNGKVYYTSGSNGDLGRVNLDGTGNESLIPKAGNLTGIALGYLP